MVNPAIPSNGQVARMNFSDFVQIVNDIREEFQREEDQGLLQHDMNKAQMALAGKYACDRILRRTGGREGLKLIDPKFTGRVR
jgi:hypothetical protein